jgi:hypothetical protein
MVIDNVLSLEAANCDVVCRPVSMSKQPNKASCPIEHLENKDMGNVDFVVQDVDPHLYEYKRGVKNIGFLYWHQSTFTRVNWAQCCNIMDEIWVTCEDTKNAAIKSGVKKPITVIPHARNVEKFNSDIKSLDLPELKNKCVFYNIGYVTRRQNVSGLIRSYYAAFNKYDDVILLLKPFSTSQEEDKHLSVLKAMISEIKKASRIYANSENYPKISILHKTLNESQLNQFHKSCDIFVSLDRGEPWNIFLHDAMGFGNPCIFSKTGGQQNLSFGINWPISGQQTTCLGVTETMDQMDTGKEFWFDPDLDKASKIMKSAFSLWKNNNLGIMRDLSCIRAKDYDYHTVGKIMKAALEGCE